MWSLSNIGMRVCIQCYTYVYTGVYIEEYYYQTACRPMNAI